MFRNPSADLLVVLLIVLLIWGPKRLPSLGRQLGQGIREFKDSITGGDDDEDETPANRPQLTQAHAPVVPPPATPAPSVPAAEEPPAQTAPTERRS